MYFFWNHRRLSEQYSGRSIPRAWAHLLVLLIPPASSPYFKCTKQSEPTDFKHVQGQFPCKQYHDFNRNNQSKMQLNTIMVLSNPKLNLKFRMCKKRCAWNIPYWGIRVLILSFTVTAFVSDLGLFWVTG